MTFRKKIKMIKDYYLKLKKILADRIGYSLCLANINMHILKYQPFSLIFHYSSMFTRLNIRQQTYRL